MDGRKFAQVPMGLPGVTAAARVLVGAGYEWTTHPCLGFSRRSGRRPSESMLCPASRCAKIHATWGAVCGSGSSRRARRPHAACALFG